MCRSGFVICWGSSMLTHLLAKRGRNTPKLTTEMGKYMHAKLVTGTENDKHDNHEIIKTENTQEYTEKHQSHEEMRYIV
jgi:hypothetical protein